MPLSLIEAIWHGDMPRVEDLLRQGCRLDGISPWGETALMAAARRGDPGLVARLLDAGADPNVAGSRGRTALTEAFGEDCLTLLARATHLPGRLAAIKHVLFTGVVHGLLTSDRFVEFLPEDLQGVHQRGIRLVEAADDLRTSEIEMILGEDEAPEVVGEYGGIALTRVCGQSSMRSDLEPVWALARMLLRHGARPGAQYHGVSPIRRAIESLDPTLVQMLLAAGVDSNLDHGDGVTPLMIAAGELRDPDDRRQPALPAEVFEPRLDAVIRLLLQAGADVNARRQPSSGPGRPWGGGVTALIRCASCFPLNIRILLEAGADATARTDAGTTALHECEHPTAARLLLDHGADVAAVDDNGETPLHKAATHGRIAMAEWLLQFPEVRGARRRDGLTALDCARRTGQQAVVDLLVTGEASPAPGG